MAEHLNRAPRVNANFRLSFSSGGSEIPGRCMNISASGLLGHFAKPLELWTEGELTVHFGEGVLGIKARVSRVMDLQAGLVFLASTAEDREAINAGTDSAQASMGIQGSGAEPPF